MSMWVHPDLQRCLCWDTAKNDWCEGYWDQCENYWQSTYGAAAAGAVAAIVLVVFLFVYYIMRVLSCLRCVTCCIVKKGGTERGTSKETVKIYRKWVTATMLSMGICVVFCIVYRAGSIHGGMVDVNSEFTKFRENMVNVVNTYEETSLAVATMLGAGNTEEIIDQSNTIKHWTNDMDDAQSRVMNSVWVLDLLVTLPIGFCAFVLIMSMLRVHRIVPEIAVFIAAFFVFTVYMIQITFGVSSVVTPDVCDDYSRVSAVASQIMKSQLKCDNSTDAPMGGLVRTTDQLVSQYVSQTCEKSCEGSGFSCLITCNSFESVSEILYNKSVLAVEASRGDCTGSCPISKCAEKCLNGSSEKDLSVLLMTQYAGVSAWYRSMSVEVAPLASCEMFSEQILAQKDNICNSFDSKLSAYSISVSVMCFLATVSIIYVGLLNCIYEKDLTYERIDTPHPAPHPSEIVGIPIMSQAAYSASYGATQNTVTPNTMYPTPPEPVAVGDGVQFVFDPVEKGNAEC